LATSVCTSASTRCRQDLAGLSIFHKSEFMADVRGRPPAISGNGMSPRRAEKHFPDSLGIC